MAVHTPARALKLVSTHNESYLVSLTRHPGMGIANACTNRRRSASPKLSSTGSIDSVCGAGGGQDPQVFSMFCRADFSVGWMVRFQLYFTVIHILL